MELETSYTEVKKRFPKQVAAAVAEIRKGKSRDKDMPEKEMRWVFDICVTIKATSFQDLLSGKAQDDEEREDAMTAEEAAKDEIKRTHVGIVAKAGRARGFAKLPKVPFEVAREIRRRHKELKKEQEAEEKRQATLTPEQKQKEIEDLLAQLPGVVGVTIPVQQPEQPTLEDEVKKLAGELSEKIEGFNVKFEPDKDLQGLVPGKALTYGELRKAAAEKTPVWCRYKEHGEQGYRVNDANHVEIQKDGKGREYASFDNGSSFSAGDIEIEGHKDDEVIRDDEGEGIFEVFEAKKPGMDLKAIRDKLIDGDKKFLKDMLANVPSNVPQEAVDAVKKKLADLEAGKVDDAYDVQGARPAKKTMDDFLNADLDSLAANFQQHAREKLKGRNRPLGR